ASPSESSSGPPVCPRTAGSPDWLVSLSRPVGVNPETGQTDGLSTPRAIGSPAERATARAWVHGDLRIGRMEGGPFVSRGDGVRVASSPSRGVTQNGSSPEYSATISQSTSGSVGSMRVTSSLSLRLSAVVLAQKIPDDFGRGVDG